MNDIEIKVSGFEEISKQLLALPEKIAKKEVDKALRQAAKPMLAAAKANAPVLAASTPWRRAGTLRKAIRIAKLRAPGELNRAITIGVKKLNRRQRRAARLTALVSKYKFGTRISEQWNDPYYWYFVERGTVKMQPRRFLGRAFDSKRQAFIDDFRKIIGERIEKVWRGG